MSKETGGLAFPLPATEWHGSDFGMTMRDYFAAKAMQGELSKSDGYELPKSIAKHAYEVADAMLKEREK